MNELGLDLQDNIIAGLGADDGLFSALSSLDGGSLLPRSQVMPLLLSSSRPQSSGLGPALDEPVLDESTLLADSANAIVGQESEPNFAIGSQTLDPITGATSNNLTFGGQELIGGYIETDSSGEINVEYLFDSGQLDKMRVGVFSLEGMDAYSSNWSAFKIEAAQRIQSDSVLGREILNDSTDAAKFTSPVGWIAAYNTGQYQGIQTFELMPDAQYGLFVLRKNSWSDVIANPNRSAWWLGLELEGSPELFDSKQIGDVTGDGTLLGIEDIALSSGSGDRDYDDILFQITGADFVGHLVDDLIDPNVEWRNEPLGQEIIDYALAQIGDEDPPVIQAALANDTGTSSTDGLTNDATVTGTVTDSGNLVSLRAGFGNTAVEDYVEIIDSVDSSGNFSLDRAALEAILANRLTDGFYELNLIATDSNDNSSQATTVSFHYDSTAPELDLLTPLVDGDHTTTARLIGSATDSDVIASASYSLDGGANTNISLESDGSFDLGLGFPTLSLGDYQIVVEISDAAGNETSATRDFAVTNDLLAAPTGTTGWAAANSDTVILSSRDSFFSRAAVPLELGQSEGTRTLSFELETDSAGADMFQVFLVDSSDPTQTLLDGGQPGTAVFSLMNPPQPLPGGDLGETALFVPGLVRYDGTTMDIDLSSLGNETSGQLIFQAIDSDPDSDSIFQVKSLSNIVDEEGFVGPVFPVELQPVSPGGAIETSGLNATSDLEVLLGQVRLDEATGDYTANLQVRNNGTAVGRNVVISFPDLPSGVSVQNASGIDANGNPYINLRNSIDPSGLDTGETSAPVEVVFANPNLVQFSAIGEILVGGPNSAPTFEAVGSLTVMPGSKLEVPLIATDPDGDMVTYQIQSDQTLPTGKLSGNGTLSFAPTPDEIGTYTFNLIATDGAATTTQEVTLTVEPDPVTTTRVSGTIENTAQEPLAGVVVELGDLQATTAADGTFTIEVAGPLPDDTLKVLGQDIAGSVTYPFIAEKLPLVLERDVYSGYNNVISRPIYLPPIDTANAVTIDPNSDVTVTTAAIPGAAVEVAAGSLLDQQGSPYTGELSITAVPNDLTPAALPANLTPDLVVTIQPGEMVFTTPAPLDLPNLAGYEPGQEMDLWSINPVTGQFDNVGTGQVIADGSVVETISGGIRNSSWHFFAPPPPPPNDPEDNPRNQDSRCEECQATSDFTSSVEMHSGAVLETHDLVPYQSLGATRSLRLTYDSLRADPRAIVHFGYNDVPPRPDWKLTADLTVSRGNFSYQLPGLEPGEFGLNGGQHFWNLPEEFGDVNGALQVDLRSTASGQYDYDLNSGVFAFNGSIFGGTTVESNGKILHVNSIDSDWGAGWGLAGLQELVSNPDGSILLIDGDGSELLFDAPTDGSNTYVSPPGDFSTLEEQADGTFTRTLKDETVYRFNSDNKLSGMVESNGNETQYQYNGAGQLDKITDPASKETTFSYTNGKITAIIDPANRSTILEYDSAGNLTRIIDPDGEARTFGYDSQHHIVSEIDKRGNREQTFYDFAGRATKAIRKDGTELMVAPVQVQGLYRPEETIDPLNAPVALVPGEVESFAADASGNVTRNLLDNAGQTVNSVDSAGFLPSVSRNDENLVTERVNGRGRTTTYEYDERGNVITIADEISGSGEPDTGGEEPESIFVFGSDEATGFSPVDLAIGDIDGNSTLDVVTANSNSSSVSVLLGSGDGSFLPKTDISVGSSPSGVALGDLDNDDNWDLVVTDLFNDRVSVLLGNGDGTFGSAVNYATGSEPAAISLDDLDSDGDLDLVVANNGEDSASVFLGNGDGSFADQTKVFGEGLSVGGPVDKKVTLADLDADSDVELILSGYGYGVDSLLIHEGNGDGTFDDGVSVQAGESIFGVAVADLDDDGNLDLVTANVDDDSASVLFGNGDGTFDPSVDIAASLSPVGVAIDDVDSDGDEDVVLSGNGFGSEVFINDGEGVLTSDETVTVGSSPETVELADLNGDGSPDLVTANRYSHTVSIRLNATNPLSTGSGPKRFTYDPVYNQLTSSTDEEGRQTLYDIDPVTGNTLSVTQVVGEVGGSDDIVTNYTYTSQNQIDTMTDPLGRVTNYDYDGNGNLTQITFAVGTSDEAVQQFEYDAAGNQTASVDENGNRTEYEYDALNRLVRVTLAVGTADEAFQQFEYDGDGNRTAFVDENGHRTEYEYDLMGRMVKTIEPDPDGSGPNQAPVTSYEYDNNGNQSAVVDPLGRRTEYRYDARSRLVETIYADGAKESARYDFDNNLISSFDANGNRTNMVYDARGRLIREVDPEGNTRILEYNAADNLLASTDENGYRQEFVYDDLGRQTSITDSEGTTVTEYNKVGNVIAQIDPLQNRTEFDYDDRSRQVRVKDALTGETVTTYDDVGNILSVTDPEQNTTTYAYDARNRVISDTNEFGFSRNFDYDNIGNLIQRSDRNNRIIEWTYDGLNRTQQENWLDSGGNSVHNIAYTYDIASQLIAIEDANSSYRFTYDEKGRQTSVDNSGTPGLPNVLLEYDYDNVDNLLSVSETINGKAAGITNYSYDSLNRANQITQTGTGVTDKRVNFDYDNIGQFAPINRYSDSNGSQLVASSTYTYDDLNRLENLTHSNGAGNLAFYDFEYDAASRITKIVDTDGTSDYNYDQTNQLTEANHTDANKPNESYTYDDNGNRTASHLHNSDYATGLNNRLESDGIYNYEYDAEGNLVLQIEIATGDEREFVWDYRNRLTNILDKNSVGDAVQEVAFTYDASDRRIAKEVNSDPQNLTAGTVTNFVYSGDNVLLEFVDEVFHQRYLHGPAVDQMLAQENADGEIIWNLTDHLGTGRDLIDNDGNIVNHLTYDSFGNVVAQTDDTVKSRYLFTGREFDYETGLYYYRARYYDGGIGRFIGEDAIGFSSGDTNLYRYVANRPLDQADPFGTKSAELRALLTIAQPNPARPTIYHYPISPNYSTALAQATTWFYLITEPESRTRTGFAEGAWLLSAELKDAPGRGALRPFGLRSDTPDPTIELQPKKVGKQRIYHGTIVNKVPKPASEVKFLFSQDGDNSQDLFCPALNPPQEPTLQNGLPTYPASPEPSGQPVPQESDPWWQNIPVIPWPLPRFDPWKLPV